jgi:hypothetical protein
VQTVGQKRDHRAAFRRTFTPPKPPPRMMMRLVLIRGEESNLPAPAS